jgi:aminoglycoside/choline kinase family phosphotransferase
MDNRQNELGQWLKTQFNDTPFSLTPLAGDASFRRYYRIKINTLTHIVMDAPPEKESIDSFVAIGNQLREANIHTPKILKINIEQGFILLEDLGDKLLLQALLEHKNYADSLYKSAMAVILKIQQCSTKSLASFDKAYMAYELSLFQDWFLGAYLGLELNHQHQQLLKDSFEFLINRIVQEPQVFIHRDFHSRNLMHLENNQQLALGVIDFQDAMRGPRTYDLVSLLKDCYIQWPREKVLQWLNYFYHELPSSHGESLADFTTAFDFCGLQRHLKVLGVFCRLHLRDNKSAYLRDLPLVYNYVFSCLETYPEFHPLCQFMQQSVFPILSNKQLL